jgi:hypothetical protein
MEQIQKSTPTDLTFANAYQQVADAKEVVTFGAPRVQDRSYEVTSGASVNKRRCTALNPDPLDFVE